MSERNQARISVIIPVGQRHENLRELYQEYRAGLATVTAQDHDDPAAPLRVVDSL